MRLNALAYLDLKGVDFSVWKAQVEALSSPLTIQNVNQKCSQSVILHNLCQELAARLNKIVHEISDIKVRPKRSIIGVYTIAKELT